jgi:hypothetical protein
MSDLTELSIVNIKKFALACLVMLVGACSGGSGDKNNASGNVATNVGNSASVSPLSKPKGLSFSDYDFDGRPRTLRQNLSGDLQGSVQFAQTHTIYPDKNFIKNAQNETKSLYLPDLISLREALVLFTPETLQTINAVNLEIFYQGNLVTTYAMRHPYALYPSDYEGAERIEYSHRAWSVKLPWDQVKKGLSLTFIANPNTDRSSTGELAEEAIVFGEATSIVLQSIRVGMLTGVDHSEDHYLLEKPELAGTDYFQTLPVSKLIIAAYEDLILDEVILRDGTIYSNQSSDNGDHHNGDMRESVGKSQVSQGINLANYGVASYSMNQTARHRFKQLTSHHAWGNYQNGRIQHGLSGGNGMITLYASRGNEASHEWGHAFGMGHYPGGELTADKRWQRHHADSGWGFIAHRNRMRTNLFNGTPTKPADKYPGYFLGKYLYTYDAMSDGEVSSSLSSYTHYTGFTARLIQEDLESFPVPDTAFVTGYKKWNTGTGSYQTHNFSAGSAVLKPKAVGVPVATLLGGYDPNGSVALIYPVIYGNYGNVFDYPAPDLLSSAQQCWLEINNGFQAIEVKLENQRVYSSTINQFHVNVPADFKPISAKILCGQPSNNPSLMASKTFNLPQSSLKPAVIIGQEHGFDALKNVEVAEIETMLVQLPQNQLPGARLQLLIDSYADYDLSKDLSEVASSKLAALNKIFERNQVLANIFNQHDIQPLSSSALKDQVLSFLQTHQLLEKESDWPKFGSALTSRFDNQRAISTSLNSQNTSLAMVDHLNDLWFVSPQGGLHSTEQPWMCITSNAGNLILDRCDLLQKSSQIWTQTANGLIRNASTQKCINYNTADQIAIEYNCQADQLTNDKWSTLTQQAHLLITTVPADLLEKTYYALFGN